MNSDARRLWLKTTKMAAAFAVTSFREQKLLVSVGSADVQMMMALNKEHRGRFLE